MASNIRFLHTRDFAVLRYKCDMLLIEVCGLDFWLIFEEPILTFVYVSLKIYKTTIYFFKKKNSIFF